MTRQMTKVEYISQRTQDQFLGDFRDLIAHRGEVIEGIASYLQLNHAEELIALSKTPDPRLYRQLLAEALITLFDRNALPRLADLNDLAEQDLEKLRKETGIYPEGYVAPMPAPKPPTAEELLRQEIASDWRTLPMDKVRAKKNGSKQYAAMLEKMANEGTLDSVATSLQRAGG